MYLPNWKGTGNSACTQFMRENPAFCVTLAAIPKQQVTYDHQSVWIVAPKTIPEAVWKTLPNHPLHVHLGQSCLEFSKESENIAPLVPP